MVTSRKIAIAQRGKPGREKRGTWSVAWKAAEFGQCAAADATLAGTHAAAGSELGAARVGITIQGLQRHILATANQSVRLGQRAHAWIEGEVFTQRFGKASCMLLLPQ